MQYSKLFDLLARGDVKEIALQSDRPPCVLVGEQYKPITPRAFPEDEVIAVLVEAGGRTEVLQLLNGHRRWDFNHPTLGPLKVSAGYHGSLLQARIKRGAPTTAAQPSPAAARSADSQLRKPVELDMPAGAPRQPVATPAGAPATRPTAKSDLHPVVGRSVDAPVSRSRSEAFEFGDLPPLMGSPPAQAPAPAPAPAAKGAPREPAAQQPHAAAPAGLEHLFADAADDAGAGSSGLELDDAPMPVPEEADLIPPVSAPPARPQPAPVTPRAPAPPPAARAAAPAAMAAPAMAAPVNPAPVVAPAPSAQGPVLPPRRSAHVEIGDEASAATFDALLQLARAKRASDLHIVSDRPPMLRIAGDLVPQGPALPDALVERMILPRLPERARRDLELHGSCDCALVHPTQGRFRANATYQRTGMKLTARPITEKIPTLEELGLPESIGLATHHHQGLIVVTGPTGHGKTTTLAAIVDIINRERTHHIITVEDPIEYVHPRKMAMLSQREVGTHTKTFAAALKGSLREDPDVIVVGELRDTETVRMALSASETGHLVISTMNTPSAAKAIERIIDLFPPGDQPQVRMTLAGGLRLITSQRLMPTADKQGLVAAAELLPGTPALWALIRDNKTFQIPSLQQRGKALGIIRLDDSLAELVRKGATTFETAREYAEAPEQFEALVQGRPARPADQVVTAANIDPTREAKEAALKVGKDMFAKAGKLFGNEKK